MSFAVVARSPVAHALGFLGLAACVACAEGSESVTRLADGVRYEGRFINPEAYAAYTLGVEREAHGEFPKALAWYAKARSEDPESPEILARLGAVLCFGTSPGRGLATAKKAFNGGVALDPNYYGNYFERARCAERAGALAAALSDATAAVARRPGDEPANLLVARLLQALGRAAEARAWLEAFQSYHDTSPAMARALDAARRAGTPSTASEAAPNHDAPVRSTAFAELRAGKLEAARQHAQTELGADPTNSDAWIATLVACDALRDNACFESALGSLKTPSLAPSVTGLTFLSELLARRAGAHLTP